MVNEFEIRSDTCSLTGLSLTKTNEETNKNKKTLSPKTGSINHYLESDFWVYTHTCSVLTTLKMFVNSCVHDPPWSDINYSFGD